MQELETDMIDTVVQWLIEAISVNKEHPDHQLQKLINEQIMFFNKLQLTNS